MDIYMCIAMLSLMHSWLSCTVLSAPAAETPAASAVSHVRTKRCSCATFLDKECVYFCHLDIIWVNTPERVVSYGLGNAPRTRRALADSAGPRSGPRCRCVRGNDDTCASFCRLRSETPAEAQRKPRLAAADTGRIKRMKNSSNKYVSPSALRAVLKTRLFLEKWRVKQRRRARAWEGESAAS